MSASAFGGVGAAGPSSMSAPTWSLGNLIGGSGGMSTGGRPGFCGGASGVFDASGVPARAGAPSANAKASSRRKGFFMKGSSVVLPG